MQKPKPIQAESATLSTLANALHRRGFRFRKAARELPGHPHLVFPRWKTAIFVCDCQHYLHGCPTSLKWSFPDAHTRSKELAIFTCVLSHRGWKVDTVWRCEVSDQAPISSRILNIFDLTVASSADG
ncbi:hypothetical protein [uncultured Brevundimonas sp.]|uniref:hypothetical protein n=1 Tax=uncultured Brevundimonas sp. TaxID=213418 RepID=UPI0034333C41